MIDRRRGDEGERLGRAAERLVETLQKLGRKARRKGRARLVDQRADALEAEPPQRRARVGRKAQRLDRQGRKRCGFLPGGQDDGRGTMEAGERPGRSGRIGDGEPRRQAETIEPVRKIGEQRLLAAEEMRGAGDVEKKAVRAVLLAPGRDGRRVARRPQRQAPQRGSVGGGIGGAHLQHAGLGARIGHLIADHQPFRFGRRVQGGDARPAGGIDGEDERLFRINRLRATRSCAPALRESAGSASAAARLKRCAT